ncbi:MAG: DUF4442 domain-containing protein, partial [Bacteroidota bacterium]
MMDRLIYKIANKAFQSEFYRFILSRILSFAVPFNSPHRLRIKELDRGYAKVRLPFIRSNRNHVNSVHACALATLCEFTCGISIMTLLSSDQYRIVLKSLQMEYQYRGRGAVFCEHRFKARVRGRSKTRSDTETERLEHEETRIRRNTERTIPESS